VFLEGFTPDDKDVIAAKAGMSPRVQISGHQFKASLTRRERN
jgi:hypothetical protein